MLYLNAGDIMRAVTLDEVMDAVGRAYLMFDEGTCCVPDRAFYSHDGKKMLYMPCFAPGSADDKDSIVFP